MNCKPVKTQFRQDQFDYRQIHRQGDVAIYEQTKAGTGILAFEVIKIRVFKASPYTSPEFTHYEAYPSSEQWGVSGWTAKTKIEAYEKARELLNMA